MVEADRNIARKNEFPSRGRSRNVEHYPYSYNCEPIDVEYCKNKGYNFTRMPNTLGLDRQHQAKMQLDTYKALVEVNCSSELQFFLCAVYLPMCHNKLGPGKAIVPCQGWCRAEKYKCSAVLKSFDIPWPEALNCSQFPQYNGHEDQMCMEGPKPVPQNHPQTTTRAVTSLVDSTCR